MTREMACFICGCKWDEEGQQETERPPCPECGGCIEQQRHLYQLFPEGSRVGAVTLAALPRQEACPQESVCTTAATDTIGMAYDEMALADNGYIPNWHRRRDD